MSKTYNEQEFTYKGRNSTFIFKCETTNTRNGICHHCYIYGNNDLYGTHKRVSWWGRTWEYFRYASVLSEAIDCIEDKPLRDRIRRKLIDNHAKEEQKRADAMCRAFKRLHGSLSQENKDRLANSGIEMHSETDAQAVMGIMNIMKIMEG